MLTCPSHMRAVQVCIAPEDFARLDTRAFAARLANQIYDWAVRVRACAMALLLADVSFPCLQLPCPGFAPTQCKRAALRSRS